MPRTACPFCRAALRSSIATDPHDEVGHWIILRSLHCYQPIRGEPDCTYFKSLKCGSVTSPKRKKEPLPAMSLPCLHSISLFFSLMPPFTAGILPPNWGQWTWHHPKALPFICIINNTMCVLASISFPFFFFIKYFKFCRIRWVVSARIMQTDINHHSDRRRKCIIFDYDCNFVPLNVIYLLFAVTLESWCVLIMNCYVNWRVTTNRAV